MKKELIRFNETWCIVVKSKDDTYLYLNKVDSTYTLGAFGDKTDMMNNEDCMKTIDFMNSPMYPKPDGYNPPAMAYNPYTGQLIEVK